MKLGTQPNRRTGGRFQDIDLPFCVRAVRDVEPDAGKPVRFIARPRFAAIAEALELDEVHGFRTPIDKRGAEREQWNDANNVLTIRPGVVIGYERNIWTNEKYDKAGITVLPIPGDELGRGRGGARCMSCPLERDGI